MFCSRDLGRNESVESFPVGRRLAFDGSRGRLWVVCRRCEKWNLTPLVERWEAVEDCERLFRDSRLRASTENIGIARLHEGLELVRIGSPLRPEFAAWRYGDQFGRRRKRAMVMTATGVAVAGAVAVGGAVTGLLSGAILAQFGHLGNFANVVAHRRTAARLRAPDGKILQIRGSQLDQARFLLPGSEGEGWGIQIKHRKGRSIYFGADAFALSGRLMTRVNRQGGRKRTVEDAVKQIEEERHPEAYLEAFIRSHGSDSAPPKYTPIDWMGRPARVESWVAKPFDRPGSIRRMDPPTRLAVEMALHEEQERRALEGELRLLEQAWRDAEEVAAIADDLLLPQGTEAFLERHRGSRSPAAEPPAPRSPSTSDQEPPC